jgi:uncharacterized protein YqiB (DUF1249 family)
MNIYQNNYQKILKIIPGVFELEEFVKLSATGAKDLNVHIMHRQHSRLVIALSHYHKDRSGDLVPELDFTIAMYSTTQTAEVLMYEDCFGYRRVYSEDGLSVSPSTKKELNSFLDKWLSKLFTQGHRPA